MTIVYVDGQDTICAACREKIVDLKLVAKLAKTTAHYETFEGVARSTMYNLHDALIHNSLTVSFLESMQHSLEYDDPTEVWVHNGERVPTDFFTDLQKLIEQVESYEDYTLDYTSTFDDGEGVYCAACGKELLTPDGH